MFMEFEALTFTVMHRVTSIDVMSIESWAFEAISKVPHMTVCIPGTTSTFAV